MVATVSKAIAAAMVTLALASVAQAGTPVTALPGLEPDEITKCVRRIDSAKTLKEAAAAYAKGCTVNRRSSELQRAYLKRLLQFGRPDLAESPATELLEIDPNSPLALGTVAYEHARKGQYLKALTPAVAAARLEPGNAPLCQNAAQLVAWYEAGKRGNVSAATQRAIKALPSSGKQLAAAYQRAKDAFKKLDTVLKADKEKLAAEAAKEAEQAENERDAEAKKLESAGKTYTQTEKRRDAAASEANRAAYQAQRTTTYESQRSAERRRDAAQRRLRELNRELARQLAEGKKLRKQWDTALKDAAAKRAKAKKLAQEAKKVGEGMPATFGWLPPAVDGVCTPDATLARKETKPGKANQPDSSYLVTGQPKGEPARQGPPLATRLAEAQAADKLQLAKICASSSEEKMKARARELLQEILTKYPSTSSAVEAKQFLDKLAADKADKPKETDK